MLWPRHAALAALPLAALTGGAAAQTAPQPVFLSVTIAGSKITGVGTGAGTVAAGNDPRIVGAVQGPLWGDVATTGTGGATTIQPGVLTNAKLATTPAGTLKGNAGASSASPADLTTAQVKSLLGYAGAGANSDITSLTGLSAITLAGPLSINGPSTGNTSIALNKAASGVHSVIYGQMAGKNRWALSFGNDVAEGGGNAGSDFALYRYDDGGNYIDGPLSIARATGALTIGKSASIGGTLSIAGSVTTGSGYYANDRSGSGHSSVFYRNSDTTRLWDYAYGDTIIYDTAGNVTIPGTLSLTTPLARTSGGTGATSLSGGFDAAFNGTQGSVLYRGASSWAALGPGTAGQVLVSGGAGANPAWQAGGGNGTVTSVALSLPSSLITVSGSPVTSSGTLAGALVTQAVNTVFAGPTSGSSAAPTFRALAPADLPAAGAADGCVRLSISSTTAVAMNPYGCNTLTIGGVPRVVTATTGTISSPAATTIYYAYASWSGTAVTLSFSTTGHITGSDGREYLSSGGSTPTAVTTSRLVGMALTNGSGQFVDAPGSRTLFNFFGRRPIKGVVQLSGAATVSTSYVVLGGASTAVMNWGDESVTARITGSAANNGAGGVCYVTPTLNSNAGTGSYSEAPATSASSNAVGSVSAEALITNATIAEGANGYGIAAKVSGGTCTFNTLMTIETRG